MAKFSTGDLFDNRYQLLKELGGGQDAEVWTAIDTLADELIVLKIFVRVGEKALDSFFADFKLLKNLSHENILKPFDIGKWESQPYQKIDFVKNGSIFKRVEDEKPFSEHEAAVFLAQVSSALDYLHQNDIVHCDVKPENVLLKDDDSYLLTDFGISQKMKNIFARATIGKDADTTMYGFSRAYAPPEISNKTNLKASRDIFSLGASLYELLTGELPFDRDGGRALLMGVTPPSLPETFSVELNTLIHKCLSKDPEERPTAQQLTSWANTYLKTGAWDLSNEIVASIPSKKPTTVPSRDTIKSNPKPVIDKKPDSPITIIKKNKRIVIGLGIVAMLILLYFMTKKKATVQTVIAQKDSASVVIDSSKKMVVKPVVTQKKENVKEIELNKIKPRATLRKELTKDEKAEPTRLLTEQNQRIEDLLNDGELAINDANNKALAIQYFTQARFIKQQYNLSSPRSEKLYKSYLTKGDAILATELYTQAKAWYQVAQSLNSSAEVRQKIEICTSKLE